MTLLFDMSKGIDALLEQDDPLIRNITGDMTVFPLCCSTGVLKNLTAGRFGADYRSYMESPTPISKYDLTQLQATSYIHDIIKMGQAGSFGKMPYTTAVARWYAMSLILTKVKDGKDTGGIGGYSNYKAAQITMFDRTLEDKHNKSFRFSYNTVYSCDHLMDWLGQQGGKYGEVLISTPKPGAHGARVRGCIFTPDLDALEAYHAARRERLLSHMESWVDFTTTKKIPQSEAVDKIASSW